MTYGKEENKSTYDTNQQAHSRMGERMETTLEGEICSEILRLTHLP